MTSPTLPCGMAVPVAYLSAVIDAMREHGRDFDRHELTLGEQLEVVIHFRAGFTAGECAALMSGERVRPVLAGESRT